MRSDSTAPITAKNLLQQPLDEALKQAVLNNDFRLFATSGRRTTYPGLSEGDIVFVEQHCGKKFIAKTGDVLTSEQQRIARVKAIEYSKQYNQRMVVICRESQAK